jgi:hypothetical protein
MRGGNVRHFCDRRILSHMHLRLRPYAHPHTRAWSVRVGPCDAFLIGRGVHR